MILLSSIIRTSRSRTWRLLPSRMWIKVQLWSIMPKLSSYNQLIPTSSRNQALVICKVAVSLLQSHTSKRLRWRPSSRLVVTEASLKLMPLGGWVTSKSKRTSHGTTNASHWRRLKWWILDALRSRTPSMSQKEIKAKSFSRQQAYWQKRKRYRIFMKNKRRSRLRSNLQRRIWQISVTVR